jgi:hypothetical protein
MSFDTANQARRLIMNLKVLILSFITITLLSFTLNGFASNGKGVPTEKFQWGPYEDDGLEYPMAYCDGFNIILHWRGEGFWTTHYNKDGSIKFEFFLGRDTYAYWYNSEDPEIGYYSHGGKMNRHWYGVPFESDVAEVGLILRLNIPGHGQIFHEAGRIIYDLNGDITFSAGPHDLGPYWDFDFQTLCPYFMP